MKFHPDVLRCHEQFGGDLEDMQRRYDAPDALAAKDAALSEMRKELERVRGALKPFSGYKLPSSRRIKIAYNRHGLRCAMSDLEIAQDAVARALASQDEGEER